MSTTPNEVVFFNGRPSCCGGGSYWWRGYHWKITNQYVEYKRGICCQTYDTLQLIRISDIKFENGKCCCDGCSTIIIESTDKTDPLLRIEGLPGAKKIYDQIRDIVTVNNQNAKLLTS